MNDILNPDVLEAMLEAGNQTKAYRVTNAERGEFTQVQINSRLMNIPEAMLPYPRDHKGRITINPEEAVLTEAAGLMSTPNFPDLLRQGVQFDSFMGYNEAPITYRSFVRVVPSSKQKEEYIRDAGIGIFPIVPEGAFYPQATLNLADGVIINNYKRGLIIPVTEEMRKFDQTNKVRDLANMMGRAARMTEEYAVMDVLTTTTNYTRNSTTNDNNIGANTAATLFGPAGLELAYSTLRTMKDRTSGMNLGVMPDTLIIGPRLWFYAQKMIQSPESSRVGGNTTNEPMGIGSKNPFFGLVPNIIVSAAFSGSYSWALIESGRSIVFQEVEGLQILPPELLYTRDVWDYRARVWFGVGMKDDRFAYFSSSTAAPTGL